MNKLAILLTVFVLAACGGKTEKSAEESTQNVEMDRKDKLRLKQYVVKGGELYNTYCSACHQATGEGLASLYPPLKQSDFLLEDLARAACIIKNGQTGSITVNGETYNSMMPGLGQLTDLEIAEIVTYISNSWGNEKGLSGVKEVTGWLEKCE